VHRDASMRMFGVLVLHGILPDSYMLLLEGEMQTFVGLGPIPARSGKGQLNAPPLKPQRMGHFERIACRTLQCFLRKDDNSAFHTQDIVQRADIRVNPGRGEGDAKPRRSQRSLRQSDALLRRGNNEPRMHAVGG